MSEKREGLFSRAEEVLGLFRKGAEFTQELLRENERLRREVARLEGQQMAASDEQAWEKLRGELLARIESLEGERTDMLERLRAVEDENQQFTTRYIEIEEENNNLASLYVASFQLHSTLHLPEVLQIIVEIVINLIGAEIFAIYVLDEKTNVLSPVASEGAVLGDFPICRLGQGLVGGAVASGETACVESDEEREPGQPIVAIPLRVQERPIGAIAIQRLLQQKDGFTPLDHELFTLLAGHAATAIFAARLYSQSERKLNTIQGFIDLLTK
jgi:hypothetical protein